MDEGIINEPLVIGEIVERSQCRVDIFVGFCIIWIGAFVMVYFTVKPEN